MLLWVINFAKIRYLFAITVIRVLGYNHNFSQELKNNFPGNPTCNISKEKNLLGVNQT
jgi:hypothetical protein